MFDVDYFIQKMSGFIEVVKELPAEIASKEPFHVDCSKRKGLYDYVESVLPSLLEHRYISFTPAMSQRRDRYHSVFLNSFIVVKNLFLYLQHKFWSTSLSSLVTCSCTGTKIYILVIVYIMLSWVGVLVLLVLKKFLLQSRNKQFKS